MVDDVRFLGRFGWPSRAEVEAQWPDRTPVISDDTLALVP